MARTNWKREHALLQAKYNLLCTQYDVLEQHVMNRQTKKQAPKGACIVTLNGKARMSALSHKDAYHFMVLAKQHGMRAQYRPYH